MRTVEWQLTQENKRWLQKVWKLLGVKPPPPPSTDAMEGFEGFITGQVGRDNIDKQTGSTTGSE